MHSNASEYRSDSNASEYRPDSKVYTLDLLGCKLGSMVIGLTVCPAERRAGCMKFVAVLVTTCFACNCPLNRIYFVANYFVSHEHLNHDKSMNDADLPLDVMEPIDVFEVVAWDLAPVELVCQELEKRPLYCAHCDCYCTDDDADDERHSEPVAVCYLERP